MEKDIAYRRHQLEEIAGIDGAVVNRIQETVKRKAEAAFAKKEAELKRRHLLAMKEL